jgi:hypothetical protein
LYVHVYTVNGGIRIVVCTCINSEWGIRIVACPHSLFIHVHTTMRIPPFTVYACTYNYTDSLIHCVYMCIQLCGFLHSLSIHVHATIQIPSFTVYICTYNHTVNGGIRIVVCTCINSEWGIRIVACTCIHSE